jgi:hypothetical protein
MCFQFEQMKRSFAFKLLVGLNVALAACLVLGLKRQNSSARLAAASDSSEISSGADSKLPASPAPVTASKVSPTPFAAVYSPDAKQFAANLRAIGCPDQTIEDILMAEVHSRFRDQEQTLKPTPADHVPYGWGARTTEPRLLERREEAAGLAREEGNLLRGALGCEAAVSMPLYAMTSSDLKFEGMLSASPGVDSCYLRSVHDDYWAQVRALEQRTKGFWLPEDVAELEQLKARRRQTMASLLPDQ